MTTGNLEKDKRKLDVSEESSRKSLLRKINKKINTEDKEDRNVSDIILDRYLENKKKYRR